MLVGLGCLLMILGRLMLLGLLRLVVVVWFTMFLLISLRVILRVFLLS